MVYYLLCEKDRNYKLHDSRLQKEKIVKQYHRERQKALQSQYPQVKKYIEQNEVNIELSNSEYIKQQIYRIKILKKKAEKYKEKEDIRGFFR